MLFGNGISRKFSIFTILGGILDMEKWSAVERNSGFVQVGARVLIGLP